jgi:hypothetical protein
MYLSLTSIISHSKGLLECFYLVVTSTKYLVLGIYATIPASSFLTTNWAETTCLLSILLEFSNFNTSPTASEP